MAFPTVETADTKNGTVTSNSTSWTLTYPTNLVSGDLMIALLATDGNPSLTPPEAWYGARQTSGTAVTLHVLKKISAGTETGNFAVGLNLSEQGAWRVFRITGWARSIGTSSLFDNSADGGGAVIALSSGTSSTPDPPDLNPATWGTDDTLWIAACAVDTSRTISVYPLADLNTADVSGGSTGATLGICMKNDAVESLNPGTFTISTSDEWAAATIGIRPYSPIPEWPGRRTQMQSILAQ
jgi:hypothetical protein